MRGRGYSSRGSGPGRGGGGGYRNSNYNNRMQTGRVGGRYNDNYNNSGNTGGGSSNRYHSNYSGGGAGGSHYDSRNRERFTHNNHNLGRNDIGNKRNHRDSSRDRSDERKRSRQNDYRRTASAGRGNRTPPPSMQQMASSSNYRGSNTSNNSYRGMNMNRGDRAGSSNRNRSPMGPPKRPIRTGYIPRPRGGLSTPTRGMRPPMRGGSVRIIRNRTESNEVRIMRKKLLYAQQKDRARVLKIARLTSSLRRRRLAGDSKSPRRSRSSKKLGSSDEDEDAEQKENWDKESDGDAEGDGDANVKKVTSKRSSGGNKRALSAEHDEAEQSINEDGDEDEEGNASKAHASTVKKAKNESSVEGDANNADADGTNAGEQQAEPKGDKDKEASSNDAKKEGKKETDEERNKEKSVKKSSVKREEKDVKKKDEQQQSSSKDEASSGAKKERDARPTRRDDHNSTIRKPSRFIKLTCIHCHIKCVTFMEYSQHLYSRQHKIAMRQIAMRQKAHLLRLRARQRTAQREIEVNSKEEYESKFCHLCRLHYRQPKAKHQVSEHHKTMKKFLMPYCSTCHLAFKSPMLYETHRCSLEHIRNKARKGDSDSDVSGDELREIDLNKFLTVDSVGEIDDDLDVDALLNESETPMEADDDDLKERLPVGGQFLKRVDAFFCELCDKLVATNGLTLEAYAKKHCLQHTHLKAFIRFKEDERKKRTENEPEAKSDEEENVDENTEKPSANANETENTNKKNAASTDAEGDGANTNEAEDNLPSADKLWEEVDEVLREVDVSDVGLDEDDDEEVLNIDLESEQPNPKEMNGKKDDIDTKEAASSVQSTQNKPKPQRATAASKLAANKEATSASGAQ